MTGMMEGTIEVSSEKTIVGKFIASVLTIGSGLTVGREGPSVQLGGLAGDIVGKFFPNTDRNLFIGSAASAGFAVAFNAPVASLIFAVEEILGPIIFLLSYPQPLLSYQPQSHLVWYLETIQA